MNFISERFVGMKVRIVEIEILMKKDKLLMGQYNEESSQSRVEK